MSIWVDIIKYNLINKIFSSSGNLSYTQSIDIQTENTTTFKKIATLVPKLNGEMLSIDIGFKSISGGSTGNVRTIEIRDAEGNVIAQKNQEGQLDITIQINSVKAFQKYEIYFKSSKIAEDGYYIYVPEKISCHYTIYEPNGYVSLKSNT